MSSYLYDRAREALDELFSDTSVPQGQTWLDLSTLRDEISNMMSTLDPDDWGDEDDE